MGYELQSGCRWKQLYYVADLEAFRGKHLNQATTPGAFKDIIHVTRVVRIPEYELWVFPLKRQYDSDNGIGDIAGLNRAMYDFPAIEEFDKVKKPLESDLPLDTYGAQPVARRETDLSGLSYNQDEIARARMIVRGGKKDLGGFTECPDLCRDNEDIGSLQARGVERYDEETTTEVDFSTTN